MNKNIILCADGTGNKGGDTPDSNVYKLYNAVDLHNHNTEQIAFYDNGVGTQTNKYVRGFSGALGFGFKTNVCDLYEYLARHYNPGDNIYMFGFSRGAATIRAFNGFVAVCGLIDGRGMGNKGLKDEVKTAMKAYANPRNRSKLLSGIKRHPDMPGITFIGVWDTVSALGFPERTDVAGVGLKLLSIVFKGLGTISDKIIPHKFYNYELTPNVGKACQALAIDDERTSFWPKVWRENSRDTEKVEVEQVWFAGMHSNIGGSYQRAGLANVTFDWMLENTDGLIFKDGVLESAKADANVNGRMYDSRHGFASYYRYHPREITKLCEEAGTKVKIHESVIRRLRLRTANYTPTSLPENFAVVEKQGQTGSSPKVHKVHWELFHRRINNWIGMRKWLYGILLELTLGILGFAVYYWKSPRKPILRQGLTKHVAEILEYFSPKFLDGLIEVAVVQEPWWGIAAVTSIILYLVIRKHLRNKTTHYAECLRKLIIISPEGHPDYLNMEDTGSTITEEEKSPEEI